MDNFIKKLKTPISELWANNKVFLIVCGLLILAIKFQDVIFSFLVNSAKKLLENTQKNSDVLQNQQNTANSQANQLIQEANKLNENRPSVDDDWHKNES